MDSILVIKFGALGDIIIATGFFRKIKDYYKNHRIVLLTSKKWYNVVKDMSFFDEIKVVNKCKFYNPFDWFNLYKQIKFDRNNQYKIIFDLQTSSKTFRLSCLKFIGDLVYKIFLLQKYQKTLWCGHSFFGDYCYKYNDEFSDLYNLHQQISKVVKLERDQLILPDLTYLHNANCENFLINGKKLIDTNFCLIIPNCSIHRVGKRWSVENFAKTIDLLIEKNFNICIIGSNEDIDYTNKIIEKTSNKSKIITLCGQTDISHIATLAKFAKLTIGLDTGPSHIAAYSGCSTIFVVSTEETNIKKSLPEVDNVEVVVANKTENITSDILEQVINKVLYGIV